MKEKFLLFIMVFGFLGFLLGATFIIHLDLRDSQGDSLMDDTNNAVQINCVAGC